MNTDLTLTGQVDQLHDANLRETLLDIMNGHGRSYANAGVTMPPAPPMQPSPLPWTLHENDWEIQDAEGRSIVLASIAEEDGPWTQMKDAVNGRFVVKAVNCHQDLVNGCNALLGLLQLVCARDDLPADIARALTTSHRIEEARAALAKAGAL
jgi:hypothetical protein